VPFPSFVTEEPKPQPAKAEEKKPTVTRDILGTELIKLAKGVSLEKAQEVLAKYGSKNGIKGLDEKFYDAAYADTLKALKEAKIQ
jgi:hypothetical protein